MIDLLRRVTPPPLAPAHTRVGILDLIECRSPFAPPSGQGVGWHTCRSPGLAQKTIVPRLLFLTLACAEVNDVAILHHVILPLQPQLAGCLDGGLGLVLLQVVEG